MAKQGKQSPEGTPFQQFQKAMRKIVSVPKTEIDRREAEWRKERKQETP